MKLMGHSSIFRPRASMKGAIFQFKESDQNKDPTVYEFQVNFAPHHMDRVEFYDSKGLFLKKK
jgi:hypothetical protein